MTSTVADLLRRNLLDVFNELYTLVTEIRQPC